MHYIENRNSNEELIKMRKERGGKEMKKRIFVVVIAVVMLLSMVLTACGGSQSKDASGQKDSTVSQKDSSNGSAGASEEPKPKALKVLYVGVEATVEAMKDAAQKYKTQTGIDVVVDSFPQTAMREKLFAEVSAKSSYYDVFLCDGPWGAALAPHLVNLLPNVNDQKITDPKLLAVEDFIPMTMAQCVYDQKNPSYPPMEFQLPDFAWKDPVDLKKLAETNYSLIGLPFHPNVLVMAYRKDYFEDAKIKEKFKQQYNRDLAPPEDWDQFLEVTKFFTKSINPDSPTKYGATLMAKKHESLYCDWRTWARTFGAVEIDENMEPKFNSEMGVRATEYYNDLISKYKVVPPSAVTSTWDEVTTQFGSGETAIAMNYHRMELDPAVTEKGGIAGFAPVPGLRQKDGTITRSPHYGTYFLAVNAYSKNQRWAYDLILNASSPEWQKGYEKYLFHASRISYYNDPELTKARPDYAEYWPVFFDGLKMGYARPRITAYTEYSETIQKEISSYLLGEQDAKTALDKAAKEVKEIFTRENYYEAIKK